MGSLAQPRTAPIPNTNPSSPCSELPMPPPPPPPPLRQPPELPEELVGEILLRLPPDEPADLLSASLVCKRWCRLLSDPFFRRQYCRYHRTPPLLAFVDNVEGGPRFTSIVASPFSIPAADFGCVLDSRHGRVLFHSPAAHEFVVWDPLTCDQQNVPDPPYPYSDYYTATVLCAVVGCDHLDCHGGPFLLVFVGTDEDGSIWASVYSSETGAWGASSTSEIKLAIHMLPGFRIGDALYFTADLAMSILVYDLAGRGLSVIEVPDKEYEQRGSVVMLEDNSLGYVGLEDRSLYLWSWQEAGTDGTAGWKQCRVIELEALLALPDKPVSISIDGFVDGTDTIFLSIDVDLFMLKIKSGLVTKVDDNGPYYVVVPYNSFYLPWIKKKVWNQTL